jgi:hypothetical protein
MDRREGGGVARAAILRVRSRASQPVGRHTIRPPHSNARPTPLRPSCWEAAHDASPARAPPQQQRQGAGPGAHAAAAQAQQAAAAGAAAAALHRHRHRHRHRRQRQRWPCTAPRPAATPARRQPASSSRRLRPRLGAEQRRGLATAGVGGYWPGSLAATDLPHHCRAAGRAPGSACRGAPSCCSPAAAHWAASLSAEREAGTERPGWLPRHSRRYGMHPGQQRGGRGRCLAQQCPPGPGPPPPEPPPAPLAPPAPGLLPPVPHQLGSRRVLLFDSQGHMSTREVGGGGRRGQQASRPGPGLGEGGAGSSRRPAARPGGAALLVCAASNPGLPAACVGWRGSRSERLQRPATQLLLKQTGRQAGRRAGGRAGVISASCSMHVAGEPRLAGGRVWHPAPRPALRGPGGGRQPLGRLHAACRATA